VVPRRLAYLIPAVVGVAHAASAQVIVPNQGALEFILPIGARTLGMGQAATAAAVGSDALWWNPALISRGQHEAALQMTQTLATQSGTDAGFAFIYSVPQIGSVGLSLRYLSFGQSPATDSAGEQTGTLSPQSTIFAASFAAPFGNRLSLGLTGKLLRIGFPCTGICNEQAPTTPPQTGALDFGAQYIVTSDSLLLLGAAVRNIGFRLQVNDTPQADPLPSRIAIGLATMPRLSYLNAGVRVRGAADLVWPLTAAESPGLDLGGELSFKDRYQVRAGYVLNGPTGSGMTFGAGISTGRLHVDLARMLSDIGQQSGVIPTFIALRYLY
jgi:hypothetical protein